MKSDTVPIEKESDHTSAFQQFIDSLRDDLFVNKKAFSNIEIGLVIRSMEYIFDSIFRFDAL
jgi:hypothetical protein